MAFDLDVRWVRATEAALGLRFPPDYVVRICRDNGGEVEVAPDSCWWLHPILDRSDRKRLARSCNDVVRETASAREWHDYPPDAIAVGHNGCGDLLVLLPDPDDAERLADTVYCWDHETGEVHEAATSFAEL